MASIQQKHSGVAKEMIVRMRTPGHVSWYLNFVLSCCISQAFGCSADEQDQSHAQEFGEPTLTAVRPVAGPLYICYPQQDFELCIPSAGKGHRILARSKALPGQDLAMRLKTILHTAVDQDLPIPIGSAASEAEQALMKDTPDSLVFDASPFFPDFIRQTFNTRASFSGPNCYNTALIASGLMSAGPLRHVSRPEFDQYLERFFEKVRAPRFGDLVVFDAWGGRDHVGFYLFNDLIFHKKSFKRSHGYRISDIAHAMHPEAFEDAAGPLNEDLSRRPLEFYRPKVLNPEPVDNPSPQALRMLKVIRFITDSTAIHASHGSIGSTMGTIMESFSARLLQEFAPLKSSSRFSERLAYHELQSAHDQIYFSIDENLYSSPFAEPALMTAANFEFWDANGARHSVAGDAKFRLVLIHP